jgi:hypothetical protein
MKIDDVDAHPDFPRKLLDKKAYVRLDPDTGVPQLVRVEPNVDEETGELLLDTVKVTIDDNTEIIMEREVAGMFIESNGCVPLEEFSDWKHRRVN